MSTENWKEIPGFDGRYYVSDLGRVKSVDTMVEMINKGTRCKSLRPGRMMKLHKRKKYLDYLDVHLFKNGVGNITRSTVSSRRHLSPTRKESRK